MTTGSTLTRAFTGKLEVGEEAVPATIRFSDGTVSLLVGDDEVGDWAAGEVDFVPLDEGYELRAEGDAVRFVPDEESFAGYVRDVPSPSPEPEASRRLDETRDAFTVGETLDALSPEEETDLSDEEEVEALALEDPDEYFAAGLAGPGADVPPLRFGPARTTSDSPAEPPDPGETIDADAADASQEQESVTADADRLTRSSQPPEPPGPPDGEADEEPESRAAEADNRSIAGILRGLRHSSGSEDSSEQERPPVQPPDEGDSDRSAPIDDAENVKQWLLVGAGGLVLLALLGVVAWGLISLVGGGDTPARAADAPTTPVPAPTAATVPAPPTTPPPTAVPAENRAAARAFVASWNENAREYAYHMSISAERLPISTAPVAAVHLTYDEEGVLELTLAPEGTGNDRDVLVAMGLAVTWADPSLSPEGRKELLGAMGVNVDDPDVSSMGGELERNGVAYSTTVTDGIINFRIVPA